LNLGLLSENKNSENYALPTAILTVIAPVLTVLYAAGDPDAWDFLIGSLVFATFIIRFNEFISDHLTRAIASIGATLSTAVMIMSILSIVNGGQACNCIFNDKLMLIEGISQLFTLVAVCAIILFIITWFLSKRRID